MWLELRAFFRNQPNFFFFLNLQTNQKSYYRQKFSTSSSNVRNQQIQLRKIIHRVTCQELNFGNNVLFHLCGIFYRGKAVSWRVSSDVHTTWIVGQVKSSSSYRWGEGTCPGPPTYNVCICGSSSRPRSRMEQNRLVKLHICKSIHVDPDQDFFSFLF